MRGLSGAVFGICFSFASFSLAGESVVWDAGNGNTYEFVFSPTGIRWDEARAEALGRGGRLATAETTEEYAFISSWIASVPGAFAPDGVGGQFGPWVGGFQPAGSGEPSGGWRWLPNTPAFITSWATGQPDNLGGANGGGEHYTRLGYQAGSSEVEVFDNPTNDSPEWDAHPFMPGFIIEYPRILSDSGTYVAGCIKDTEIQEKAPDTNFDGDDILRITAFNSSWEGGGNGRGRVLLAFDPIPPAEQVGEVVHAWIEIYSSNGIVYPGHIVAELLTESWNETEVTWNTQPVTDGEVARGLNSARRLIRIEGDRLTAAVREASLGTASLHGVLLRFEDEYFNGSPNGVRGDGYTPRDRIGSPPPRLFVEYELFRGQCVRCTGPLAFEEAVTQPTGLLPRNAATSDLDGDGFPDTVVANVGGNLSLFLGTGDGAFDPAITLPAGNGAFDVVVTDLDGDGDDDIACANFGSNDISVLLNDGTANFTPPVFYAVGTNPTSVTFADLNLDGDQDLIVANSGSDSITVLENQGNGSFSVGATPPVSAEPFDVTTGDLNGDGILDIVVTAGTGDAVDLFLGLGNGLLVPTDTISVGDRPWAVAVGDVDGDGDEDIAVINSRSDSVGIIVNEGGMSFAPMIEFQTGDEPRSIVLEDIDGDCDLDIAVAKPGAEEEIRILRNDGSGSFGMPISVPVPDGPASLALADLDLDGDKDLLVASYDGGLLYSFLSQCTPRTAEQWTVAEGGNGHWYSVRLVPDGITWREAKAAAAAVGGYLATPVTEAENNWLFDNLVNDPAYWLRWRGPFLGGYQPPSAPEPNGLWQWITSEPWSFTAWFEGEPNDSNGTENILHYRSTGNADPVPMNQWNDGPTDATDRISYAIEWSQDCNGDGIVDYGQILAGELPDEDGDGVPDGCFVCRADLSGDGVLDLTDLSTFVGAFVLQQPEADYNSDGYFDLADIGGFVTDFVAGCQ